MAVVPLTITSSDAEVRFLLPSLCTWPTWKSWFQILLGVTTGIPLNWASRLALKEGPITDIANFILFLSPPCFFLLSSCESFSTTVTLDPRNNRLMYEHIKRRGINHSLVRRDLGITELCKVDPGMVIS